MFDIIVGHLCYLNYNSYYSIHTVIIVETEQLKYDLSGLKLYYIHTPTHSIHYKQQSELILEFLRALKSMYTKDSIQKFQYITLKYP